MTGMIHNKYLRIVLAMLFTVALVCVRAFENRLFYDPFLAYFKGEYAAVPLPEYNVISLVGGLSFRYGLNTLLSLAIIYVAFLDLKALRFIAITYAVLFLLLLAALVLTLYFCIDCKLAVFYERRFLIQPLFLLLFLPAMYYQAQIVKK